MIRWASALSGLGVYAGVVTGLDLCLRDRLALQVTENAEQQRKVEVAGTASPPSAVLETTRRTYATGHGE